MSQQAVFRQRTRGLAGNGIHAEPLPNLRMMNVIRVADRDEEVVTGIHVLDA